MRPDCGDLRLCQLASRCCPPTSSSPHLVPRPADLVDLPWPCTTCPPHTPLSASDIICNTTRSRYLDSDTRWLWALTDFMCRCVCV